MKTRLFLSCVLLPTAVLLACLFGLSAAAREPPPPDDAPAALFSPAAAPHTDVCGPIGVDGTWSLANSPYLVTCDVTVQPGVTLTVEPGVVVKFEGAGEDLYVEGRLVAQGTASAPIAFTSYRDDAHGGDTNGDGGATAPAPRDWGGIFLRSSSGDSVLAHTWIGYGGYGGSLDHRANVHLWTSEVTVANSVIAYSGKSGLYVAPTLPGRPFALTANTFLTNTHWAVEADAIDRFGDITLSGNSSRGSPLNGFGFQGTISGTVTYRSDPTFPFVISPQYAGNDRLVVPEDAALTLAPGTVVKFWGQSQGLYVEGRLATEGTSSQPVVFTSFRDDEHGGDTNGDGSATGPGAGNWSRIVFEAGSEGALEGAWIGYGGYLSFLNANLEIYSDAVTIRDSTITWAKGRGIHVEGASPLFERNTVYANPVGVYAALGAQPTLRENTITGNSGHGVYNGDSGVTVDAVANYWGARSGPYHATNNPFGEGDTVSDHVRFAPWLDYPPMGVLDEPYAVVELSSGEFFHPGQLTDHHISYANLTAGTIENAVLLFQLPVSAEYVSSAPEGIHWPERHQVFWRLGDLTSGDVGQMTVRLRTMWGVPNGAQDRSVAALAGTNAYTAALDVTPYLGYTPILVVGEVPLTEAAIATERLIDAEFDALYRQAATEGYGYAASVRTHLSSGEVVTQVVLLHPEQSSVTFLRRLEDQAYAVVIDPTTYALKDATGGLVMDLSANVASEVGSWGELLSSGETSSCAIVRYTLGACVYNCAKANAPGWYQANRRWMIVHVHGLYGFDCLGCQRTLLDGKTGGPACERCAKRILGRMAGSDLVRGRTCIQDCFAGGDEYKCAAKRLSCPRNAEWWVQDPVFDRPQQTKEACDPVVPDLREWPGDEACPAGTMALDIGTYSGCLGDRCVDWKGDNVDVDTSQFNLAHDPNAKYGPVGNVLPGATVVYTLTYENEGQGTAYGVFIVDELSEHLDESSLLVGGEGEFYPGSRTLSWYIGEVAPAGVPGSTGMVTFSVQVKGGLPSGTVIANRAVVHFPSVPEKTPTNLVVNVVEPVVALPQALETESGQPLTIVLAGIEAGALPLTYTLDQGPVYGELGGAAPTLVYTSLIGYAGLDRFTFVASNGLTTSQPAEVQITVHPWSGDTTPPQVLWTRPADGAVLTEITAAPIYSDSHGAAYAPSIVVQFSEVMSSTTVSAETIALATMGGEPVSATVTYDGTANQAKLVLREPLQLNTVYSVVVGTAVRDLVGNPLDAEVTWTFIAGSPGARIHLPLILRNG